MADRPSPYARLHLWLTSHLQRSDMPRLLWQAALAGALGALAIVAFRSVLAACETVLYGRDDGLVAAAAGLSPLWRILIPTLGGLLAGLLIIPARRINTAAASDYMEAISLRDGAISARLSLLRSASSLASIASGGSIGREGSMVQLASLSGFLLARWRKLPAPQRRLLVACGGAAGVAAAYNAPIAGALFVAEIVLRTISLESLGPLVTASVVSSIVAHGFFGSAPLYQMPEIVAPASSGLGALALLGVVTGLAAPAFLALLDAARSAFSRLPDWPPLRLGLGGLGVGLISLHFPEAWGNGFSTVNAMLQGGWLWQTLLLVLVFKLLATLLTIGSGAIGGAFTPSLFVGAALGSLFGLLAQQLGASTPLAVYVVTGMAAFLAATLHAPLTAIVIVVEMTGNLALLPPVMLASVLALALSRLLRERSIYGNSLRPLPTRSFSQQTVAAILRPEAPAIGLDAGLAGIRQAYLDSRWQHVYVLDDAGRFVGAVSIHALGPTLLASDQEGPLPPGSLRQDYPRLSADTPLSDALDVFARHSGERLPVLDEAGRLLGHASKTDLILLLGENMSAT
ncbi:ClcB-like voltage-gated chloride channel protein [Uliginosibacterium paludis]|uniref:ClcB-like voltage-gated chloride channel protein n=1 Tax=Uliginosibacterium paludis TaxID=1615952 RepID=A0ABV2CWE1_9RHOO